MTRRLLTLTTDFGLADAYVGVMKGVILQIAPESQIVDISHQVDPQRVAQAAYLLRSAYGYFPSDAIHVAVVDPGVGTARRPVAVAGPHGIFVGPDNGIFCPALIDQEALTPDGGLVQGQAVELTQARYWRQPVSRTFHGRDIFGPSAAHLANGVAISALGTPLRALQAIPDQEPIVQDHAIHGVIVHVDRFGNAISNVPSLLLPPRPVFHVAGQTVRGLAGSYQEAGLVAIVGSTGLVEIAARNASAAEALGLRIGDSLTVKEGS